MNRCIIGWVFGVIAAVWAGQILAQACPEARTPIKMAGQTLCVPRAGGPSIFNDDNGNVNLLVWSNIGSLPAATPVPYGTFHLSVDTGQYNHPTSQMTEPSDLPNMRQITSGRRIFLYPQGMQLNGQPFQLSCNLAINPISASQGGQDCQIDGMIATGLRINVHFETVVWDRATAWPQLNADWINTWPPYLANLEAGVNNLLSIQE